MWDYIKKALGLTQAQVEANLYKVTPEIMEQLKVHAVEKLSQGLPPGAKADPKMLAFYLEHLKEIYEKTEWELPAQE